MKERIKWPFNKKFAFTIIDDTDNSNIENIKSIYEYLNIKNIKTTKTVWVYPSRNHYTGQTIQDQDYLEFLLKIENQGFEIQLHNVGSGHFTRQEIIEGFNIFKNKFGRYPTLQINHDANPDTLYWGYKRYGPSLRVLIKLFKGNSRSFYGDEMASDHFWGDLAKENIKFIRNRCFNGINTLKYDPLMPFIERSKKYSNYWFSSSDGHTVEEFNNLTSKYNINKLVKENGLCIVYTHFANGFLEENGEINLTFKDNISYLSEQEGWFVPATNILEHLLLSSKKRDSVSPIYITILDIKWLADRFMKKLRYGR